MNDPEQILTLGLFEKRIEGDDCLLELARRQFVENQLGAEIHGGETQPLDYLLRFRPSLELPVVIHLPRGFDLQDEATRRRITDLAAHFAGRVHGLVVHDHPGLVSQRQKYRQAVEKLGRGLERIKQSPTLFIEYAVGLPLDEFAEFFAHIHYLPFVSACLDSGHIGIYVARQFYSSQHANEDICALKSLPPNLPSLMADVEAAMASALPAMLGLVRSVSSPAKPVHFHLHDGHPLSRVSPFGVADHLSFEAEIPLPFEHRGRRVSAPLYGPQGLTQIVATACQCAGPRMISCTLEIHPTFERLALGPNAPLFQHWIDKTNAEKMNHWLGVLLRNRALLSAAISRTKPQMTSSTGL